MPPILNFCFVQVLHNDDDFHQMNYYLNDSSGNFAVIVFRGEELKDSYFNHSKHPTIPSTTILKNTR